MNQRTTRTFMACALLCCCTSTEPAVAPLGFGPLASAERAQREQVPLRSTQSAKAKRGQGASAAEPPSTVAAQSASGASVGGASSKIDAPSSHEAAPTEGTASNSPSSWLGLWHGKDSTRFQIPSFPSEPMTDDNARIRVESGGEQELRLILIDSSNESDLCSLSAQLNGNEAQIAPGQPCFGNEDDSMELDVQVKRGKAKLEGTVLTVDLSLDAEIKSDQLQARGSVDYHFEGSR